jgi:SnoaL-like domain
MTDQAAIRDLIAAYALALDAGDIEGCVELFTADAQFLVYGRSFDGHDGVRKMFQDAPRGLHLTGVSRIDVRGNTATGRSQVLFVRAVDLHLRPALYDDEFVREDGESAQWRFQRRRCQFVTSRGLSDSPEGS